MEQLQAYALAGGAMVTWKVTAPQWQLPW